MSPSQLTPSEWELVIDRITTGRCTPFLGAGVAAGLLPLGAEVSKSLATDYGYPFKDRHDLVKVSQYVAIAYDSMYPKERFAKKLQGVRLPDIVARQDEPHRLLARLPLPLYITTNYDDLMSQALTERRKDPKRGICRWNERMQAGSTSSAARDKPTPASPLIFHLHGQTELVESMVLTEDDYLEFLSTMIRRKDLLPQTVAHALTNNTLVFIGYRLADWNFRVLLRGLPRLSLRSIAVMPKPSSSEQDQQRCQDYLSRYYGRMDIKVYWGTAEEFLSELFDKAEGRFD